MKKLFLHCQAWDARYSPLSFVFSPFLVGREVSFNAHVIFIIGSMSPLFDNADFVWRNTILTLQLPVFSNGGGRECGEARVPLMPPVADPGEGPGGPPPLFLDQTEVRRVEKKIETRPPPNLRVWMTPPPHPPIRRSGSAAGPDEIICFSLSLRYLLNKTAHFTE